MRYFKKRRARKKKFSPQKKRISVKMERSVEVQKARTVIYSSFDLCVRFGAPAATLLSIVRA